MGNHEANACLILYKQNPHHRASRERIRMATLIVASMTMPAMTVATAVSVETKGTADRTHSLNRGAPIHLVQATLGHASVATAGRYLYARPTDSSARYLGV